MSGSPGVHLELFVRSLSPGGARSSLEGILDRITCLAEQRVIDGYAVRVCGKGIPATPAATRTAFGSYLLNRVAVFHEWAEHNDLSIDSLFEQRRVRSSLTGEDRRELVVPLFVLAEYEDGGLRFVAPCEIDDRVRTVPERLDDLTSGQPTTVDPLPSARAIPPDAASPPDATTDTAAGQ